MAFVDSAGMAARAEALEAKNLNGFDFVLVHLYRESGGRKAALLEVHFLNDTRLATLLSSNTEARSLFPISGGHRVRAGVLAGLVQTTAVVVSATGTVPVADSGILAPEVLTIKVGPKTVTSNLPPGTKIGQLAAAVNDSLRTASVNARALDLEGRLAIAAPKTFDLSVRSNRADVGDGSTTGFGTTARKPAANTLTLLVSPVGDYSTYTLGVGASVAGFDPVFDELEFKFRPGCFSTDCDPARITSPLGLPEPVIDYLAKDYDSFRHVLMSWMQKQVPGWEPSSEVDLSQMLLSAFSASADELSDYQDRVMNEAYMATARSRVSLARHARLMDYHVHQGNQASTWIVLRIQAGQIVAPGPPPADPEILEVWAGEPALAPEAVVFRGAPATLHSLVNDLSLYTWSGSKPGLAAGAVAADLAVADQAAAEAVRDLILTGEISRFLIQEHRDPLTGHPGGADPDKRQILTLLTDAAVAAKDPLTEQWYVHVAWRPEDQLQYAYCFVFENHSDVTLFHGNLVQVLHGREAEVVFRPQPEPGSEEMGLETKLDHVATKAIDLGIISASPADVRDFKAGVGRYIASRAGSRLEEIEALTTVVHAVAARTGEGFSTQLAQRVLADVFYYESTTRDPEGRPRWGTLCRLPSDRPLLYRTTVPRSDETPQSTLVVEVDGDPWIEEISLVHSDPVDQHFSVETDELGRSVVRFGNGAYGENLKPLSFVYCRYQTGVPLDGNVGADRLIQTVYPKVAECWNPFDVTNGRAPEPRDEIVRNAPESYRTRQLRAVTLEDYVERVEEVPGVSRAAARYAWTGSWRTVRVTVDPEGTEILAPELTRKVARALEPVRLIGEDLEIRAPVFVPLEIKVELCVRPEVWPEDVHSFLEEEFSDGYTSDGRRAFFNPDEWTFGQTLFRSQILGRIERIAGVDHVTRLSIKRWDAATPGSPGTGDTGDRVEVGPSEIIRVQNDPDHMELGSIEFELLGGRR